MKYLYLLSLFFLTSCNNRTTPEEVLANYVQYRFSPNQTKQGLLQKLSGDMYDNISAMNENEFSEFTQMSKYKKKKFKINTQKCSSDQCLITYTVQYEVLAQDGKSNFIAEVRKTAEINHFDGKWKISAINNVKTFFDAEGAIIPIEQ